MPRKLSGSAVAMACCLGAALALGAGSAASISIPHYTVYQYKASVGIKGGMQYTSSPGGDEAGDTIAENETASYSVDGTVKPILFYSGKVPGGISGSGTSYSTAVVNGTWTDSGTESDGNGGSTQFSCTGTINLMTPPGEMDLSWTRSGPTLTFTLDTVQSELTDVGYDSCPFDAAMDWPQSVDPAAYETVFKVPFATVGRKSFSVQVSGPLAENQVYVQQVCDPTCSVTWQGTMQFRRTRVMKLG